MMTITEFYNQLNEANDIIKNIKMPNDYTAKPKAKSFYLPCNIMANILSYLPSHLDHHKKKMKIVNEDFEIVKKYDYNDRCQIRGWRLLYSYHNYNELLISRWSKFIKHKRLSLEREKELETIIPKLDSVLTEWKSKKNIIYNLESWGIEIDSYTKREKKADFINSIKCDLKDKFIWPYFRISTSRLVEEFLYSL